MAKKAYVYSGTDWVPLASEVTDLTAYSTSTEIANTYATKAENGLVHINTTSFSGVASQSIDNVFSATYDDYKIIVHKDSVSTANGLAMRLRASGADLSTSSYSYSYIGIKSDTNTQTGFATGTSIGIGDSAISTGMTTIFDISNPFRTVGKKNWNSWSHWGIASGLNSLLFFSCYVDNTNSYDGFTILASTGTMTGSISVYGYRKS